MSKSNDKEPTFEEALVELERIVRELEEGKIGLEDSLARYEQGVALLKRCHAQLRQAELRILELSGVDDQGNPITKPFDHVASLDKREKKKPSIEG